MFAPRQLAVAASLAVSVLGAAPAVSTFEERMAALYRPLQAEQVALSPDGEYIACSQNDRGELAIYIMAVNRTERKFKIRVESDRPVAFSTERAPPRLRFLRWASPQQLVFAPTECHNGVRSIAPIYAVTRNGTDPKTLAGADDFSLTEGDGEGPPRTCWRCSLISVNAISAAKD